jgi:DNA replication protein DnaC
MSLGPCHDLPHTLENIAGEWEEGCCPLFVHKPDEPTFVKNKPRNGPLNRTVIQAMSQCCYAKSPWPLVLAGQVGTGKTCAALFLADCVGLVVQGLVWGVSYLPTPSLWETARERKMSKNNKDYQDWLAMLSHERLVILDDVDSFKGHATDFQIEVMYSILEARYNKPLVITSNHTPKQMRDTIYDDRISSRLSAGTVVEFKGADQRLKAKGENGDQDDQ